MFSIKNVNKFFNVILENNDYSDDKWKDVILDAYLILPNDLRIQRHNWFKNSNYILKKQMSEYHLPIRKQLKKILLNMYFFIQYISKEKNTLDYKTNVTILLAKNKELYNLFKIILVAHERREEVNLFPNIKKIYPKFDINKMNTQHDEIHKMFFDIEKTFFSIKESNLVKENSKKLLNQLLKLNFIMNKHFCYEEIIITCYSLNNPSSYNWAKL